VIKNNDNICNYDEYNEYFEKFLEGNKHNLKL